VSVQNSRKLGTSTLSQ